jgi:HK97 family phage major capsid protein
MKINKLRLAWGSLIATAMVLLVATGNAAAAVLIAPAAAADLEEIAETMGKTVEKFRAQHKEVKEAHEEITRKMGEVNTTIDVKLKESIDKVLNDFNEKFNGVKGELSLIEQKVVDANRNGPTAATKSWGEQFGEGAFKSRIEQDGSGFQGTARQEIKQVTSASAGGLIRSYRENDVVSLLRERRVVRDLLRTVPISTSSVDYVTQTLRTNNAAPVAEAASKPYSEYAWGSATVVVRTLAHLAKITRQAMDDAPRLVGEIDAEMRYGLGFVEERQFLYGTGVGQNLHGIMPQATAFAVPAGFPVMAGATPIDVLRIAMLQASIGLLPADGIVMNALNWAMIELTKTTDGAYLFANPTGQVAARLWGLPVIATPAMTAGDFLVGNFALGATVYDRMGVEVLISTENVDDFERNLATMRAEERVAIAVKRPQAFIKGTFTTALADVTA